MCSCAFQVYCFLKTMFKKRNALPDAVATGEVEGFSTAVWQPLYRSATRPFAVFIECPAVILCFLLRSAQLPNEIINNVRLFLFWPFFFFRFLVFVSILYRHLAFICPDHFKLTLFLCALMLRLMVILCFLPSLCCLVVCKKF